MKVLLISGFKPYPLDSGGSSGIFHLTNALRKNVQFTFVYPLDTNKKHEAEALSKIWPDVNIKPMYFNDTTPRSGKKIKRTIKVLLSRFKERLSKIPDFDLLRRSVLYQNNFPVVSEQLIHHINQLLAAEQYDLIQVEHTHYIRLGSLLKTNIKKVFIHHEVRAIRAKREYDLLNTPKQSDKTLLDSICKEELEYLKAYDGIVCLTKPDAEYFKNKQPNLSVGISPLTIHLSGKSNPDFSFQNKYIFMGGSKHFPNVDGLVWFLKNTWKNFITNNPNCKLYITGNWEKRYKNKFTKYKNVEFTGFVDDLQPIIANSVLIVPIRIGAGMRMKILEAISWGIPFISTTIGAEGLPFKHKKDCEIADSPEAFKQSMINLIQNPQDVVQKITNSQHTFNDKLAIDKVAKRRLSIYQQIVSLT